MKIDISVGFSGYIRGEYEIDEVQMLADMDNEFKEKKCIYKGEELKRKTKEWIEDNYYRYLGEMITVRDDTSRNLYVSVD